MNTVMLDSIADWGAALEGGRGRLLPAWGAGTGSSLKILCERDRSY